MIAVAPPAKNGIAKERGGHQVRLSQSVGGANDDGTGSHGCHRDGNRCQLRTSVTQQDRCRPQQQNEHHNRAHRNTHAIREGHSTHKGKMQEEEQKSYRVHLPRISSFKRSPFIIYWVSPR
jgi:hypothetical protein